VNHNFPVQSFLYLPAKKIFLVLEVVVILSHALDNFHEHLLVHPESPLQFVCCICCIIRKVVGVQQHGTGIAMAILVRRLARP
jgi:hypothetical protein